MGCRVVVVDDEREVRRVLERTLVAQGYQVTAVGSAAELRVLVAAGGIDLLLLDVDIGGDDGLMLAREVRAQSRIPILMLTGHGTVFDKVAGLEAGADDYLTKPFDSHELLARVRALLRRAEQVEPEAAAASTWRFAGWTLRETERQLLAPDGAEVELTSQQFDLLAVLVRNAGHPVNRDLLSAALGGQALGADDRRIDVAVAKLRSRLGARGGEVLIETLRGRGYMLAAQAVVERGP